MKESAYYLGFLKENFIIFVTLSLIGLTVGFFFTQNQKAVFTQERLFEMRLEGKLVSEEVETTIALIDHLVTLARSPNMASELGLGSGAVISSVRFSPFAFRLTSSSLSRNDSLNDLETVSEYLEARFNQEYPFSKYLLERVGEVSENKLKPNAYLYPSSGFLAGLIVSLIFVLIKTYLKKY